VQGFYPRSSIAPGWLFIRVQSTIRADGTPSAQVESLQRDTTSNVERCGCDSRCALARANREFCADEQHIRAEFAVMEKTKRGVHGYSPAQRRIS